jgi:DNA-binding FadR family transcriptional regulator
MRAALAPDIARRCAERRDEAVLADLREVLAAMEASSQDLDRLQVLALDFWQHLVGGSDNVAYELAFNTLRRTYEAIRGALVQAFADELTALADHRAIVQAVERGDGRAAARAAARLVDRGTRAVLAIVELLGGRRPGEAAR